MFSSGPPRRVAALALALALGALFWLPLARSGSALLFPRASPDVVLSEFRTRGPNGANDEFIELYNRSAGPVDLSRYLIRVSTGAGVTSTLATLADGAVVGSGCYYLLAHATGYRGPAGGNQFFTLGLADDGGIAVLRPDQTVVDQVGLSGGSAYKEGTPLPPLAGAVPDQGYERKPGGAWGSAIDTDDNLADFTLVAPTHPQNLASDCVPPGPAPTATATQTAGPSPTRTSTATPTATLTRTATRTATASATATATRTAGPSPTRTFTATATATRTPGPSPTSTATRTPTLPAYLVNVVLNEILAHPGRDWNRDGVVDAGDEWIELYNNTIYGLDASGWWLDDKLDSGSAPYKLPAGSFIPSHGFLVVYGRASGLQLADAGDQVRLLRPDQSAYDETGFPAADPDQVYARRIDGEYPWTEGCLPSPGAANCPLRPTEAPAVPTGPVLTVAQARAQGVGGVVTVAGYITVPPCRWDTGGHELVLADAEGTGLDIHYLSPKEFTCAIRLGEFMAVTGVLTETRGLLQLRPRANYDIFRNYGSDRILPPRTVHTGAIGERLESVLLTVEGRVVNGENGDTVWLDDDSGPVQVEAPNVAGASFEGITKGSRLRVTGVVRQADYTAPYEQGYRLTVRYASDIQVLELADKPPRAPGGRGLDLGALSIEQARKMRAENYGVLTGQVTVPPGVLSDRYVWLQEGAAGIQVYVPSKVGEFPPLQPGDVVQVGGLSYSLFGVHVWRVDDLARLTRLGPGLMVSPAALRTGAVTLDQTGALVAATGRVTRVEGRSFWLDDGSGGLHVYLDPTTGLDPPAFAAGAYRRVVGVVSEFEHAPELLPRDASDLSGPPPLLPATGDEP